MAAGPQTLGRYQRERVLGKGAMGIVYEALDPKLHRKVAIKTILISQLDEETAKDFSMRFVREAHAVARLNHPNIVQVYDFGEEGDIAYLVMEFIRGDPRMPSSLNVAVSPEFARVVAKALAKNPDQRFATAREFAVALKRAAEGKRAMPEVEPTLVVPRNAPASQATHPEALRSGEMELEFWRSIKDSTDPNDFELYVRQFPQGVYASLAARKAAKLRSGSPADDSGTRTMAGADRTRLQRSTPRAETGESARQAVDKTIKLADAPSPEPAQAGKRRSLIVPAVLGVLAVAGVVTYFAVVRPSQQSGAQKVAAEAKARRDAAEAAKAEAQAKRDAEGKAQRDAQAKRDAEAQAKREAEAQAKRSADAKEQRAAELKAKQEAEAQTKREAEARAKREAEVRAKRESEDRAQRDADARAQREAKVQTQRDAESKAKLAAETSLWDSIKSSRKPSDVQKYLNRYPNGQYAEAARQRLLELESARLDEAAKKQHEPEKKKSTIIVPPTF